jgi:hypothetical protein
MAARLAPSDYDQSHHFIADGVWDAAPLESELLVQADRLVGQGSEVPVMVALRLLVPESWTSNPVRLGTKGRLKARFAAVRIRIADEPRSGSRTRVNNIR